MLFLSAGYIVSDGILKLKYEKEKFLSQQK